MATQNNKKMLYDFTSSIKKETDVEEKREENGQTVIVKSKKVTDVPVKIILYKPSRKQREEADLEKSSYFFYCTDRGLYSRQQLAKVYKDKGGDLSKEEAENYLILQTKLLSKLNEIDKFRGRDYSALNDEEKLDYNTKQAQFNTLRRELIDFETERSAIFENTADTKSFHRLINWFKMNLIYKEVDGKIEEFFKGSTFEEKMDNYDKLLEERDELLLKIDGRISAYVTFWYHAGPEKKEDFKVIDDELGIVNKSELVEIK